MLLKLLPLVIFLFASCSTVAPNWQRVDAPQACMVNSVGFKDAYDANKSLSRRWSKILLIAWSVGPMTGAHAVCVFQYGNELWVYDPDRTKGSRPITSLSYKNKPQALAEIAMPTVEVRQAVFGKE